MKRTQVQLPDWLFAAAHELAETKEISMAELVRRGLEYMLAVSPARHGDATVWELPAPQDLGSRDPFEDSGWRERLHMQHLKVAEAEAHYGAEDPP